ncbi:hypothetical protein PN36_08505 [Candidatus Thiomargarita nelsonii]|uniref:Uncharacterized protein n=1 Tax=Candidatus Thiomargarita nelsonii TaxID=1003181 RepID=A0A0A6P899_9GAMM|nr:hypothetical protein PN36_08505 [Candidatus Thiomargarita nelsonii]
MYKEKLPKNCPPKSAVENDIVILYRIFQGNKLDASEFIPYNTLYPDNKRFQQMCDAFGISFYTNYDCALSKYKEILGKGKKMGNFIAKLKIKQKSGFIKINSHTGHCNFWFYERFDIYNDIECLEITKL